jgi:hypothetical protein
MQESGSQFLHNRNPNLHSSQEVGGVVDYLRANGEQIPNEPAQKIESYLGFLANKDYVNDGILTGDQTSIDRQIDAHVIKAEDVPESYFELERRIARERGHGDVQITSEMRKQMTEAVQADQKASLGKWVEYLGGDDGGYPDWFKSYAWNSVAKLGNYDKEKSEFLKRSRGTTAAYPELNREGLAYVYDVLNKSRVQGEAVDGGVNNEQLQKHLKSGNFGKLYAHAVLEVTPDSPELRKDTRGSWTKFNQSDDPRTARRLSGSLQGHGTGWCTAGESTASIQLAQGDFFVYYTRDEAGKDTVPRVAIRMEHGEVAEVRGVNAAQELESVMADITAEQLKDLPGSEAYIRKAEDMKRLTEIHTRLADNPSTDLSEAELRFLYEIDGKVEGFGYGRDPRLDELQEPRDIREDLSYILDCRPEDIALTKDEVLEATAPHTYFRGDLSLDNLTSAEGLTLPSTISGNLGLSRLTSAEGLTLPSTISGGLDLAGLTSAEGLTLPSTIGRYLYLDGLTSAEGLTLPNTISGGLYLAGLTSAEGLTLPNTISGSLDLDGLTSAEGLTLPNTISGGLYLSRLTSAEGLTLPNTISGDLNLSRLTSAEGLTLPSTIGGGLSLSRLTSAEGLTLPSTIGGGLSLSSLSGAEKERLRESRTDLRIR